MFLETPRMPEPWRPEPPGRRLSKRGEAVLLYVICFNLFLMLLAPIGGATLIEAILYLFAKPG